MTCKVKEKLSLLWLSNVYISGLRFNEHVNACSLCRGVGTLTEGALLHNEGRYADDGI